MGDMVGIICNIVENKEYIAGNWS